MRSAATSTPSAIPTSTRTLIPFQTPIPTATETRLPISTTWLPLDQLANTVFERSFEDRPDDMPDSFQIHIIYVIPHNGLDRNLDTNGQLNLTISAIEKWLIDQTGGSRLRFDTYNGGLDITFYELKLTDQEIQEASVDFGGDNSFVRDVIENELRKNDLVESQKLYAVYFDGLSNYSCGGGAWPPQIPGQVAALYLNGMPPGSPPCGSNDFTASIDNMYYLEFAMLHEIMHTLGFVTQCGINHTRAGHVSDSPEDLMWAGDAPWSPQSHDINNDDYFKNSNSNCPDLSNSAFLDPLPRAAELPPNWGQSR